MAKRARPNATNGDAETTIPRHRGEQEAAGAETETETAAWLVAWRGIERAARTALTEDSLRKLLMFVEHRDPLVAFRGLQVLRRLLQQREILAWKNRAAVVTRSIRLVLEDATTQEERATRHVSAFRLQLLRQLIKSPKPESSEEDAVPREEDEEIHEELHTVYLQALMENATALQQLVVRAIDLPDPSVVMEAVALASDVIKRVMVVDGLRVLAIRAVNQLGVVLGRGMAAWHFASLPTFLACGAIDFMADWYRFITSLDADEQDADEVSSIDVTTWLRIAYTLLHPTQAECTPLALKICNGRGHSDLMCSETFVSLRSGYPFLQKWIHLVCLVAIETFGGDDAVASWGWFLRHSDDWKLATELPTRARLMAVLSEQDDIMLTVLQHLLKVSQHITDINPQTWSTSSSSASTPSSSSSPSSSLFVHYFHEELDPDALFSDLLLLLGDDHIVVMDMLMSSETCMLEYLLHYLRRCSDYWAITNKRWSEGARLQTVMAVLIRLRMEIERLVSSGVFPYNPSALVRRLERIEALYEQHGACGAETK